MKETKKIIPFIAAIFICALLIILNPDHDKHKDVIKSNFMDENPKTWRIKWWNHERALEYQNYLFFSMVKRINRPVSIGALGIVFPINNKNNSDK